MSQNDTTVGATIKVSDAPWQSTAPTSYIWVQAGAAVGGDGSAGRPFATIQAAVNAATPGSAIMVHAGTYTENIKLPSKAMGTSDHPVWIVSADGPQAAKIVAATDAAPVIKGLGTDNVVISGFEIRGGTNGIQFSQSGANFTNMVENIVIQNNVILGAREDGIKISQADKVFILDNVIKGAGDQGVDFVATNHSVIARNDVSNVTGPAGIFAKGGSTDVLIADNYVHNVSKDGIAVGGWTEAPYFRPGFTSYEASQVTATGNVVEGVGMRPVNILGATNSAVVNNLLEANPAYFTAVQVGQGNPYLAVKLYSSNIEISGNTISRVKGQFAVEKGGNTDIRFHDNHVAEVNNTTAAGPIASLVNSTTAFLKPEVPVSAAKPVVALEPVVVEQVVTAPVVAAPEPVKAVVAPIVTPWAETGQYDIVKRGGGGGDNIVGTALNDYIDAGRGNDTMIGGQGDDTYVLSSSLDKVIEFAGEGVDTAILYDDQYFLAPNVENLIGRYAGGMMLGGNELHNIITGGAGADTIVGGAGSDKLTGGGGADLFLIGAGDGHDVITDFGVGDRIQITMRGFTTFQDILSHSVQSGGDVVITLGDDQSLTLQNVNLGSLTAQQFNLDGVASTGTPQTWTNSFNGQEARTILKGTDGADGFDGKGNGDVFVGGKGDDWYTVKSANDVVVEYANEGVDTVYVRTTSYLMHNNIEVAVAKLNEDTEIVGNSLANTIKGLGGNDRIEGGGGADTLTGGAGADIFVYSRFSDGGDKITDFKIGQDKLDLSALFDLAPNMGVSFASSSGGLMVYADHDGQHDLLATLQGVTASSLTANVDYII